MHYFGIQPLAPTPTPELHVGGDKNDNTLGTFVPCSFHKARNKCVSTLRRARKQHLSNLKSEPSKLSPSSKSWWRLIKSVSGVCSPPSPLLPQMATLAECLNSVFASKSCVRNPLLSVPTLPSHTLLSQDSVSFSPDKVESLLSNLN